MFTLAPLPYEFNALEPAIDAKTIEIHYSKHHQTYCDKLNTGLEGTEYADWKLEELLSRLNELPDNLKPIVRNHGGGLLNHTMYWETMTPNKHAMSASLQSTLEIAFGSIDEFKTKFVTSATNLFGSGRTWLEISPSPSEAADGTIGRGSGGGLQITNYPNQENPLMYGKIPVLGIDIWEHAYYLKCQNRRAEYINAWWDIVDRDAVERNSKLKIKN